MNELVRVLHASTEFYPLLKTSGLADVAEPESGQRRWLWWRSALRERWQAAASERRAALGKLFRSQRLSPLFIEGAFDADAVTRHFLQ